jgi:hypothetical protein
MNITVFWLTVGSVFSEHTASVISVENTLVMENGGVEDPEMKAEPPDFPLPSC